MSTVSSVSRHVAMGDIVTHNDPEFGFEIASVREPAGARLERHAHEHASCMIVTSGTVTLDERDGVFLLSAGMIAIRPAGAVHVHAAGPSGARYVLFEVTPSFVARLGASAVAFDRSRTFAGRSSMDLAVRISGELNRRDEFMPLALRIFAQGIALGCARYTQHGCATVSPIAAAARRVIERDLTSPLNVAALARSLGCSNAHLSRTFRQAFGLSPQSYSLRRRVERGRRLLATTTRSIADVALALGFHDSSHFAKHFRRLNGIGAREFRRVAATSNSYRK
jgi:AraC-like DNA-binding protein/quercetin dioxygenase-like cupin family protein